MKKPRESTSRFVILMQGLYTLSGIWYDYIIVGD